MNKDIFYTSMAQASSSTGFDKKLLKTAKKLGAPGFDQSNRVNWTLLEPWLKDNKNLLESQADESLEHYKIEKTKLECELLDLKIKEEKENLISPEEIKQFLNKLGILLSSVLKKKREELMSKITGYESIVDKEFQEVFKTLDKEMEDFLNER